MGSRLLEWALAEFGTKAEAARRVGKSQSNIDRYFRGQLPISFEFEQKLRALGADVEWIKTGRKKEASKPQIEFLEIGSVALRGFKDKTYLSFTFNSTTDYNTLKLNRYDIGKILFDEVVRKVLNPLNDHLGDSKSFYGYDLSIVGHSRSFAEKYSTSAKTVYRFLLPSETVRRYKNKDISGQQVLDGSIILMDDERIELKLQ